MANQISRLMVVLGLALSLVVIAPQAMAQVNPTAESVTEDALFDALGTGGNVSGRISIPNQHAGQLIAPENRDWAALQGDTLHTLSIWAVIGMVALLTLFYLVRGKIRTSSSGALSSCRLSVKAPLARSAPGARSRTTSWPGPSWSRW